MDTSTTKHGGRCLLPSDTATLRGQTQVLHLMLLSSRYLVRGGFCGWLGGLSWSAPVRTNCAAPSTATTGALHLPSWHSGQTVLSICEVSKGHVNIWAVRCNILDWGTGAVSFSLWVLAHTAPSASHPYSFPIQFTGLVKQNAYGAWQRLYGLVTQALTAINLVFFLGFFSEINKGKQAEIIVEM